MKVLIFGVSGMLGNTLFRYLAEDKNISVYATARTHSAFQYFPNKLATQLIANVDVENHESLVKVFTDIQPDIVVNCIGIVKQLTEAKDPLLTIPINSLLPHRLAALCKIAGARLIHISTDCVFSGTKGNYLESDFPDADDLYGRSKLLGEVDYPHAVTLRTSIIGHELSGQRSLLNWFLAQQNSVKGFTHAIYSGFPTVELSNIIRNFVLPRPEMRGLYHVASKPINKYDLLQLVAKTYKKTIEIIPSDSLIIDRSLNAERFNKETEYVVPGWPELVERMYEFKTGNG
ncbi:MAG: NAD(P)-dependent oxidoreductase [Alphaproteobacteria bacterium 41-28]|nr:MAG: NAD(P)-dependent oxidoreductase [Alphaproteobacteria bacterium 41-28]